MTELEELKLAYAECSRQRNELLTKRKQAAQREAELMGVGMESVATVKECDIYPDSFGPIDADVLLRKGEVLYTADQIAAARLQGAAQREAELLGVVELPEADWECFSESGCSYYGLAYYEKTVRELIAAARLQGERVNQELLEALHKLACLGNGDKYGNSIGNEIARAAIAAAEKEQA